MILSDFCLPIGPVFGLAVRRDKTLHHEMRFFVHNDRLFRTRYDVVLFMRYDSVRIDSFPITMLGTSCPSLPRCFTIEVIALDAATSYLLLYLLFNSIFALHKHILHGIPGSFSRIGQPFKAKPKSPWIRARNRNRFVHAVRTFSVHCVVWDFCCFLRWARQGCRDQTRAHDVNLVLRTRTELLT